MIRDAVFISVTIPRGRESSLGASGHFPPRGILPWVPAAVSRRGGSFPGCQQPFPAAGNPSLGASSHFPRRGILQRVSAMVPKKREAPPGLPAVLLEKWGELSPFAVGALLAVFGLLFGRTAAMRSGDILFFLGLGLHLLFRPKRGGRTFAEGHSAARDDVVDVHLRRGD